MKINLFLTSEKKLSYSLSNQCSLIKNTSMFPSNFENLTSKSLSNITFTDNDIGKIIKKA